MSNYDKSETDHGRQSCNNAGRTLPKPIPFVGWSSAASRFREVVASHAPGGKNRVLLLGPTGVGKKTMAKVWQKVAGNEGSKIPIVNLDSKGAATTIPDPCIAISTLPLPRDDEMSGISIVEISSLP